MSEKDNNLIAKNHIIYDIIIVGLNGIAIRNFIEKLEINKVHLLGIMAMGPHQCKVRINDYDVPNYLFSDIDSLVKKYIIKRCIGLLLASKIICEI